MNLEVMKVEKEKISKYIKGKEFYFVLLLSLITVFAVSAIMILNNSDNDDENKKNIVDLNEPLVNEDDLDIVVDNERLDIDSLENEEDKLEVSSNKVDNTEVIDENIEEETVSVMSSDVKDDTNVSAVALSFDPSNGLSWPINGEILIDYSMDQTVYFETLNKYECNPALFIKAMIGDEVKSAAKGIVKEISNDAYLGNVLTIDIGDGYEIVYAQIEDILVTTGDKVEPEQIIAKVAEPTNFYKNEGSHLYFKVLKDGNPINPNNLLQ